MIRSALLVVLALALLAPSAYAGSILGPTTIEDLTVAGQAVGDLIYADTTSSFTRLADIADGNVLRSGGVGAAPVYGKVRLSGATTDITGTLAYGSGGTGATSYTTNAILKAGASAFADSSLTDNGTTVTSTVPVLHPDGTAGAPSGSFANDATMGTFRSGDGVFSIAVAGQQNVDFRNGNTDIVNSGNLRILSDGGTLRFGVNADIILGRAAAANLRFGAAAANPPVAQTLSMQNASGTDIAGANFTLAPSQSTGNATPASIVIQGTTAGASGTALQALRPMLSISESITVNNGDLLAGGTNDIGGTTSSRFRSAYLSTSLLANTTAASALHADAGTAVLATIAAGSASTHDIMSIRNAASSNGAWWSAYKTRSATGSDADTAVASGDDIMTLRAYAADGASYREVAQILQEVDTYTGSDNVSGRIGFWTRNDGASAALTERLRVLKAGGLMWLNGAEPTCDATGRGSLVLVQGGAGVADTFRVCTKDAADAYAYRALF